MPNRDQRRRDGTFEYAQLDLAPASDEPARCLHGRLTGHDYWTDNGWRICPGPAASGTPDGGS